MNLHEAANVAENLVREMRPNCEQIIIAGSIRRQKPEVKDIEIVCVPKRDEITVPSGNLFEPEKTESVNRLHNWATLGQTAIQWIKPGVPGAIPWDIKPDGKYWRGLVFKGVSERVKLDLFLANADNWGAIATIRTGPADFSEALVGFIKLRTRFRVQGGHLTVQETGEIIPVPTERDFFTKAGVRWVDIAERDKRENPYSLLSLI